MFDKKAIARFWSHVNILGDNDCWEWKKYTQKEGYGRFKHDKKPLRAHRVSWIIHNGVIPNDLCILHKCDNPPCVNPSHLFLGTRADNAKDRDAKGRNKSVLGEFNPNSKLTEKEVLSIRKMYADGKYNQIELGKIFGIHRGSVSSIITGRIWKHLD